MRIKTITRNFHLIPLCIEGLAWLAFYRLIIITTPSRYTKKIMGCTYQSETLKIEIESPYIHDVQKTISYLGKHVPWTSKCLDQALAAQQLLKRNHIPSTLYIGMLKVEKQWSAHAWLRCGKTWITGHHPNMNYTVVGTYAK